jgi:hypothetical protein
MPARQRAAVIGAGAAGETNLLLNRWLAVTPHQSLKRCLKALHSLGVLEVAELLLQGVDEVS